MCELFASIYYTIYTYTHIHSSHTEINAYKSRDLINSFSAGAATWVFFFCCPKTTVCVFTCLARICEKNLQTGCGLARCARLCHEEINIYNMCNANASVSLCRCVVVCPENRIILRVRLPEYCTYLMFPERRYFRPGFFCCYLAHSIQL